MTEIIICPPPTNTKLNYDIDHFTIDNQLRKSLLTFARNNYVGPFLQQKVDIDNIRFNYSKEDIKQIYRGKTKIATSDQIAQEIVWDRYFLYIFQSTGGMVSTPHYKNYDS